MKRSIIVAVAIILTAVGGFAQVKIVVTEAGPSEIQQIRATVPGATIVAGEEAALAKQVADADAIIGDINPELFRAARKLRWVQVYSAGVEHYVFPELADSAVVLTNCKILQGPNIADHAMSLLLSLTRDLYRVIPDRVKEEWARREYSPIEL